MSDNRDPSRQRWEERVVREAVKRAPERRTGFETTSGIPVERLYTQ